jgi:hypothetical protein
LTFNLFYYLWEDLTTYHYLPDTATLWQTLENFAVTIDNVAWMTLLVIFELETGSLSEKILKGGLKWAFNGTVAVCYAVLLYAAYGYVVALVDFYKYDPITSETVCELVKDDYAYVNIKARFIPLDQESCTRLSNGPIFKHRTDRVISDAPALSASIKLSWIDVINAGVWLLIVLLFEIEVILKDNHTLSGRRFHLIKGSKAVLYSALLGNAIYWTVYGAFIDYWDAYLWLVAFVLVDMNLFDFQKDSVATPATAES